MASIVQHWKENPALLAGKSIPQIVAICGNGKLKDDSDTSKELRELLSIVTSEELATYAKQCLEETFTDSGIVLQDIINQIGVRLGFTATPGRYRGVVNKIGHDGIWTSKDGYNIIIEVKTTDAYRINLDVVATYRLSLIAEGKISKDRSSILIVVGRQDTGDLEAQIRGSRHAWDVRLISTNALTQLMLTKQKLNDWATSQKINELLKPMEYTRVDPIINLIFTTSEDIVQDDSPEPDSDASVVSNSDDQTKPHSKAQTTALRSEALPHVSSHLKCTFVKMGQVLFTSSDETINLVCLASQSYLTPSHTGYWFGFSSSQLEFLTESPQGFVALVCGLPQRILLIPISDFKTYLPNMNQTPGRRWHIILSCKGDNIMIDQPLKGPRQDVTKFLLSHQ